MVRSPMSPIKGLKIELSGMRLLVLVLVAIKPGATLRRCSLLPVPVDELYQVHSFPSVVFIDDLNFGGHGNATKLYHALETLYRLLTVLS